MNDDLKNQTKEKAESLKLAAVPAHKGKKKYDKPRIVYQAPLEAMAGFCAGGKAPINACGVLNS